MNTGTVVEALQRNFGGMPQQEFQDVVRRFVKHLAEACGPDLFPEPQPDDFRPTLEVLADALAEGGHALVDQHATLSDRSARPKLVIDYTGKHHPMKELERHQLNLGHSSPFHFGTLCNCTCIAHSNMHPACCNVVHRLRWCDSVSSISPARLPRLRFAVGLHSGLQSLSLLLGSVMEECSLCSLCKQVMIQHTVCCSAPTRVASQSWTEVVLKCFR